MAFEGQWKDAVGQPERSGTWIVWGNSSNGKSHFAMKLAKYLSQFGRVSYDSLEEGASLSMKKLITDCNMNEVASNFTLLDRARIDELNDILTKRRSPFAVIIDSVQYLSIDKESYHRLKEKHKSKLLIFISHAEGKEPSGNLAKYIRYDADVKIRIEGFKAFSNSRFGGGQPLTIWDQGANEYWGN